jgi:dTDP-4-amino-4,6-dideoxygalactose transaminase
MQVPFLDLQAQYASIRAAVEPRLLDLCASQGFVLGPEVQALEAEIAAYTGSRHAIGCASGTDALILALMSCDVGPGDEVIVPSFTFMATGGAVALRHATPVFVDILPASFNVDPAAVEAAITSRTRAIIAVDLYGQCADMQAICDIGARHGVTVIEDAAQSIGAEHRGRRAGGIADLTTFSFYPSKNLGGFGDGGMITTKDDAHAERLRRLRVHGETARYVHDLIGTNSRLDALQAAVLRIKLQHLDDWVVRRQAHARAYRQQLLDAGLQDRLVLPETSAHATRHVWNQFTLRVPQRDALRQHLTEASIGTGVYYPIPMHRQKCFASLPPVSLPATEAASREVLSLPLYPELREEQRQHVVRSIVDFFA